MNVKRFKNIERTSIKSYQRKIPITLKVLSIQTYEIDINK